MGEIKKRGKVYWIRYYRNGVRLEESAHTDDWRTAKQLLVEREEDISTQIPAGARERAPRLYAIENPHARTVKIGISIDPEMRLRQLESTMRHLGFAHYSLILRGSIPLRWRGYERAVHAVLLEARTCGEWFSGSNSNLQAFVDTVIVSREKNLEVWLSEHRESLLKADSYLKSVFARISEGSAATRSAINVVLEFD